MQLYKLLPSIGHVVAPVCSAVSHGNLLNSMDRNCAADAARAARGSLDRKASVVHSGYQSRAVFKQLAPVRYVQNIGRICVNWPSVSHQVTSQANEDPYEDGSQLT